MCTENVRFLKEPIPSMYGYKVLHRVNQVRLESPVFQQGQTPWNVGETKTAALDKFNPSQGFHFFASWLSAWCYKRGSLCEEIHRVRARNVFAEGHNSCSPFGGKVYIAEQMELML